MEKLKNNIKREEEKEKYKERKIQRKTIEKCHHNQDYLRDDSTNAVLFTQTMLLIYHWCLLRSRSVYPSCFYSLILWRIPVTMKLIKKL